ARSCREGYERQPANYTHRKDTVVPRQPAETAGHEPGQRIEIRHEHGDFFEGRAVRYLARYPAGRGLQLVLHARVLLEINRAVGPLAPRALLAGQERPAGGSKRCDASKSRSL